MNTSTFTYIAAMAALVLLPVAAQAADDIDYSKPQNSTVVFTGVDIRKNSTYYYGGFIHAFDGFGVDSLAVRGVVGGGKFDYDTTPNASLDLFRIDGDSLSADFQIGYRMFQGDWQTGIYLGVNYQNIDQDVTLLNPGAGAGAPPAIRASGTETGFKVDLEATRNGADNIYVDLRGNYSTAFETYWSRARIGYNMDGVIFGPEGALLGNEDFDQYRVGAFLNLPLYDTGLNLSISGGYSDNNSDISDTGSIYGAVGISVVF